MHTSNQETVCYHKNIFYSIKHLTESEINTIFIYMKNTNLLKTFGVITASMFVTGCVSTCSSTEKPSQQEVVEESTIKEPEAPVQEIKPVSEPEKKAKPVQETKKPVEKKEEPKPEIKQTAEPEVKEEQPSKNIQNPLPEQKKKEEPKPEVKPEPMSEEDEEFARSVEQMADGSTVTHETFNADKKAVLELIDGLKVVMAETNYNEWLKYLDEESIKYWSQKSNLQKAQKRLPIKGLKITSLEDYFKYVFIPSRNGKKVDEIRYITDSLVKVVQIRKDEEGRYVGDTVYYNLRKIDGQWKVHLPEL